MDLQAEKLELVKMLLSTENERVLKQIKAIFRAASRSEKRISVSQYNKELLAAEKRIKKGKFASHQDVIALLNK